MSPWFSASLGDPLVAGELLSELEARVRAAGATAGDLGEMAVFVRHESEGRLHCEVRAYFSPAAVAVARAVGAEPCDRPSREGLSLLVGSPGAWHTLFPGRPA